MTRLIEKVHKIFFLKKIREYVIYVYCNALGVYMVFFTVSATSDKNITVIGKDGTEYKTGKERTIKGETVEKFDFGYCITSHISQGLEFDDVQIHDYKYMLYHNHSDALYVARTRAKKSVSICLTI